MMTGPRVGLLAGHVSVPCRSETNSVVITAQTAFGFQSAGQRGISLNDESGPGTKVATDNYLVPILGMTECVIAVKHTPS